MAAWVIPAVEVPISISASSQLSFTIPSQSGFHIFRTAGADKVSQLSVMGLGSSRIVRFEEYVTNTANLLHLFLSNGHNNIF